MPSPTGISVTASTEPAPKKAKAKATRRKVKAAEAPTPETCCCDGSCPELMTLARLMVKHRGAATPDFRAILEAWATGLLKVNHE